MVSCTQLKGGEKEGISPDTISWLFSAFRVFVMTRFGSLGITHRLLTERSNYREPLTNIALRIRVTVENLRFIFALDSDSLRELYRTVEYTTSEFCLRSFSIQKTRWVYLAFSSKCLFTFSSLIASLRPDWVSLHSVFNTCLDLHFHIYHWDP